jgi:HEAT repeat protein
LETTDIEQIFTGLRSDNDDVRQRSEQAFLHWGEFSVPAPIEVIDRASITLARVLRDPDSRIRGFATSTGVVLTIRADSGKALRPLTPLLLAGFSDPDPLVRSNSISAVVAMKPAPPFEATDALVDLLKPGHDVETQRLAAYGLVRIVPMRKPWRQSARR